MGSKYDSINNEIMNK